MNSNINQEKYIAAAKQIERFMHKYLLSEEKKRDYGLGYPMTKKEIHTIQFIGDEPGINMTSLAIRQGVTKGAASQMVTKLSERGLVKKIRSQESESEVEITLTDEGQKAYDGHNRFHMETGRAWCERFSHYTEEQFALFLKILSEMEDVLDQDFPGGE